MMQDNLDEITVRVIVFQDEGLWVAQCLEYDIGAQADDIDTLNLRLQVVLAAELKERLERNKEPFGGIDPAPERFQVMWERRARSLNISSAPWITAHDKSMNLTLGFAA